MLEMAPTVSWFWTLWGTPALVLPFREERHNCQTCCGISYKYVSCELILFKDPVSCVQSTCSCSVHLNGYHGNRLWPDLRHNRGVCKQTLCRVSKFWTSRIRIFARWKNCAKNAHDKIFCWFESTTKVNSPQFFPPQKYFARLIIAKLLVLIPLAAFRMHKYLLKSYWLNKFHWLDKFFLINNNWLDFFSPFCWLLILPMQKMVTSRFSN